MRGRHQVWCKLFKLWWRTVNLPGADIVLIIGAKLAQCWILRYTSGAVRLWDTLHWDSTASYLKTNGLSGNTDPRPFVRHVQVNNTVAAAAYEDGECLCLSSLILIFALMASAGSSLKQFEGSNHAMFWCQVVWTCGAQKQVESPSTTTKVWGRSRPWPWAQIAPSWALWQGLTSG